MPADMEALRAQFGKDLPDKLFRGRGCRQCQATGYHGRRGIFELMPINEAIRMMILDRASASDLRREAVRLGMRSLREDGWRLIQQGDTTLEEVLQATKDERVSGNGAASAQHVEAGSPAASEGSG